MLELISDSGLGVVPLQVLSSYYFMVCFFLAIITSGLLF